MEWIWQPCGLMDHHDEDAVYAVNQSVLLGESLPVATGATVPIGMMKLQVLHHILNGLSVHKAGHSGLLGHDLGCKMKKQIGWLNRRL